MQAGADEDKIQEVPAWRESRRFSEMERAALEYAEAMTITGQRVSDELFARLRSHFDEAQIVELTAVVALENFRSKFNVPLGVESQGICVLGKSVSRTAGRRTSEAAADILSGCAAVLRGSPSVSNGVTELGHSGPGRSPSPGFSPAN